MGAPQNWLWGQAGGSQGQGQPLSRFQVMGEPSEIFPVWAAGTLDSMAPAWLMDARGAAYRYGLSQPSPGFNIGAGVQNLLSDGTVLRAIINGAVDISGADVTLQLGGIAAGGQNIISGGQASPNARVIIAANQNQVLKPFYNANGEFAYRATGGASNYGAVSEQFSFAAATLTATNGLFGITSTLANGFGSAATLPGYAYTPSKNFPFPGDVIEIVDGGTSKYFRLTGCNGATATIFPAYNGTGGAGLTYRIYRTGYGCWSNVVRIQNGFGVNLYYAGNAFGLQIGSLSGTLLGSSPGVIECIQISSTGVVTHFSCPQTSAAAVDCFANDVIYYKSFLLYGAGPGISWSAAGFPSSFTTGFGGTDLPSINTSAFNTSGDFYRFSQVGEQVLAHFDDSTWLVQATGSVPEFAFYRLPGITGALPQAKLDPQMNGANNAITCGIQTASSPDSAYFSAPSGAKRLSGLSQDRVSQKIDSIFNTPAQIAYTLTYDDSFGAFWSVGSQGFLFTPDTAAWTLISAGVGSAFGLSVGEWNTAVPSRAMRSLNIAYWSQNRIRKFVQDTPFEGTEFLTPTSADGWIWAMPMVSLGDIYPNFIFGGFKIWARGPIAGTPPNLLTWSVWGGVDPYKPTQLETGTFDYTSGTPGARDAVIGTKQDEPYIGIVLSGLSWIELAGIGVCSTNYKGRR